MAFSPDAGLRSGALVVVATTVVVVASGEEKVVSDEEAPDWLHAESAIATNATPHNLFTFENVSEEFLHSKMSRLKACAQIQEILGFIQFTRRIRDRQGWYHLTCMRLQMLLI